MKKVLLAVLCAGLFFACGNKKQAEPEALVDTAAAVVEEVIEEAEPVVEEAAPVAENTATTKKAATPAKKTTTNNSGLKAGDKNAQAPTVKEQAESAANRVAGKAIEKGEEEATNKIVNAGKKRR